MEAFSSILNTLLGSQRSGGDLAVLLLGLAASFLIVSCRREIVGALVGWFAGRVSAAEKRAQACTLLAQALSEIQDGVAAALTGIGNNQDRMLEMMVKLDALATRQEAPK